MEQSSISKSDNVFDLHMDQQCLSYLLQTAKWNKFLSVVWFVLCGLFIIIAFIAGGAVSGLYDEMPGMDFSMSALGGGGGVVVTIIYLLMTAVYLIPNFWRYKFSVQAIRAIYGNDQVLLNSSMNNLRKYSKYWGIFTIVIIGFYVVAIILAIIGAAVNSTL
ncbi:MAG: hypothetical protein ACTHMC_20430 [Pseudobacter sp.]|uniref:hypothetical protein n=1 Tax=Pseudobacter sp. TaxID=2045420 RepID=UPI003F7F40E9